MSLWIQEEVMKSLIKYGWICALLMSISEGAIAQGIKDSVVEMKTVPILSNTSGKREGILINNDDMKLDADYQSGKRVSDILGENTSVFIKNYGVGQLSSISINGSSAAQAAILWNGIKINNSNTGQVDLALFDMGTVDNLSVTNTANNQYLGGALALNTNRMFSKDTLISNNIIRYGSFNTMNLSTNNTYSIGMFSGSTKINYLSSANDFPFVNNTQIGAPVQTQVNAATTLLSFLQQLDLRIKKFNAGAMFWLTDADRQLPPTMTEANTFEREWDKSYRSLAYLNGRKGRFSFSLKTSYLYDWLRYMAPIGHIDSRSSTQASRNLFNATYSFKGLLLDGTIHYDHEQASSSGFYMPHTRDVSGINISVSYRFWSISKVGISVKQDLLGITPLPFSPGAFITIGKIIKKSTLSATLSGARVYRLPTLNDLYWYPGGNPDLRPEHAWNSSLGLNYSYMNLIKFNVNGFYNYVTDWIQWEPIPNTTIWTAKNFKRVVSRGVNVSVKAQNKVLLSDKGFVGVVYAGYSYTNTIALDAISADDDSKDKQLIYAPLHNFSASLHLQYRRYYIRTIHSYTGVRYTATDDSQFLPGYYLTHLEVGKDFYFNNQRIGLSFRACNITNCQYQVMEGSPMPGRSYEMTARLNLSK